VATVGAGRIDRLHIRLDVVHWGDPEELVDVVVSRAEAAVRREGGDAFGSSSWVEPVRPDAQDLENGAGS
jgi:hypothetical protein